MRRSIHRLLNRRLTARTRRPFQQLLALKVIARGEVTTQAQLAERLLCDAPATSRLVDRLQEEGMVTRESGEDRRCVRLQVTEACWPEVGAMQEEIQRLEDDIARHLEVEEMSELKRLLDKVQAALGQNTLVLEKQPLAE